MPQQAPRPCPCSPSRIASKDRSIIWSRRRERCTPKRVPTMRKDFLVEPYQVAEARLAGAGGILIIVRMLDRAALLALIAHARSGSTCSC